MRGVEGSGEERRGDALAIWRERERRDLDAPFCF
jgi:hypothetical protein